MISLTFSLTNCKKKSGKPENGEKKKAQKIPVEVSGVAIGDINAYYTGTATIESEGEAVIVAKTGGIVQEIYAEEGDYVSEGQVLAKLDDDRQTLELKQAEITLNKMKNEFERMKKLYQKNLNAEEEFERIKFEYETQKTIYDLKQLSLDYTSIKASISGIVTQRFIKTGNTISPNQPAFEIVNFNSLFVSIHVPEAELSKLKKGQSAILKVDALPNEQFSGKIQRISPIIDPQTGTFDVRIRLNNPSRKLKPGMFARVSIVYDVHENTLLVPKDAVVSEDKESSVFVVKDSLVLKQIVETGYQNTKSIEILNGLTLSDTVITMGTSALKDSTKVEIISRK